MFLHRVHPTYSLVIAATRDEYFDRPASATQVLSERPRSIGGVDQRGQGTWMGANSRGVVAGLTNQRTLRPANPRLRSRGHIVRNALGAASAEEVRGQLLSVDPAQYNPFNLLFADAEGLHVAYARHDPPRMVIESLDSGVDVLCNDRIGSPAFPRGQRARQRASQACTQPWDELVGSLEAILSDHELPSMDTVPEPPAYSKFTREQLRQLQAVCIHGEIYGTCSATIMAVSEGRVAHYLFAHGPPCKTPFEDVTALLRDAGS